MENLRNRSMETKRMVMEDLWIDSDGFNAEPMLMAICCVARAERAVGVQRQVAQTGRNSDG